MSPPSDSYEALAGRCRCSAYGDLSESDSGSCHYCRKLDLLSPLLPPISSRSNSEAWMGWDKLRRCLASAGKGFAIGAGLRGGLAIFSILARLRSRRLRKAGMITNEEAVVAAAKETLRYGLFLGTFAGAFVSVDEFIAALGGHDRTASWRALFAGAVAGPSLLLTGPNAQHTSLAIYILMRASVLASRCGIKSKRFGHFCKPFTWRHGDIFLMCLSSSQILSAYILKQESLPPSYQSFLNKHGGKDSVILQGINDLARGIPFTNLKGIEKHYNSMGTDVKLDPKMEVPCSIVHSNQSCSGHTISFLLEAYRRALPVYLPVYLIPALIVHRQGLVKRPYAILGKSLLGTARSSLFLSAYCSSAWMFTCILFRLFNRCNIPLVALGTERDVFRSKYLNVLDWVFGVPSTCKKPD